MGRQFCPVEIVNICLRPPWLRSHQRAMRLPNMFCTCALRAVRPRLCHENLRGRRFLNALNSQYHHAGPKDCVLQISSSSPWPTASVIAKSLCAVCHGITTYSCQRKLPRTLGHRSFFFNLFVHLFPLRAGPGESVSILKQVMWEEGTVRGLFVRINSYLHPGVKSRDTESFNTSSAVPYLRFDVCAKCLWYHGVVGNELTKFLFYLCRRNQDGHIQIRLMIPSRYTLTSYLILQPGALFVRQSAVGNVRVQHTIHYFSPVLVVQLGVGLVSPRKGV